MDVVVTVALDLPDVFHRLAQPHQLGSWLPGVRGVQPQPIVIGVPFALLLHDGTAYQPAWGEHVAYEPPRHAVWRFFTDAGVSVIRLTCTRTGTATRVHVHQDAVEEQPPMEVDLDTLRIVLAPGR